MFLLNMNKKSYIGSLMAPLDFTLDNLERSKSRSLTFWVVGDLYGICQQLTTTLIWMSKKRVCWRVGFFAVPAVFLVQIHCMPAVNNAVQIQNLCLICGSRVHVHVFQ